MRGTRLRKCPVGARSSLLQGQCFKWSNQPHLVSRMSYYPRPINLQSNAVEAIEEHPEMCAMMLESALGKLAAANGQRAMP